MFAGVVGLSGMLLVKLLPGVEGTLSDGFLSIHLSVVDLMSSSLDLNSLLLAKRTTSCSHSNSLAGDLGGMLWSANLHL